MSLANYQAILAMGGFFVLLGIISMLYFVNTKGY